LGGTVGNKLIVCPKTVEMYKVWGSPAINRYTANTTDGLSNTNTLYSFGSKAATGHPAAFFSKSLTTGGYNTWYLPASLELLTLYSNKAATPFATANSFTAYDHYSSTEDNATKSVVVKHMGTGVVSLVTNKDGYYGRVRATRRVP
jgi:hypothetical protein